MKIKNNQLLNTQQAKIVLNVKNNKMTFQLNYMQAKAEQVQ